MEQILNLFVMKKLIALLFFSFSAVSFISSCSSPSSKIEKAARNQVQTTLTEIAKDPTSVKIEDIQTKFLDDSLCVLQLNWTAKNGFGHDVKSQVEYYYIESKGKFYEAYQEYSGDDALFLTEEQYNKQKTGKIYENLPYGDGLRYLVALFVNSSGREAGNSESEAFTIPVPTGTGLWDLKAYQRLLHGLAEESTS